MRPERSCEGHLTPSISRREFITSTAVSTAAFAIMPSTWAGSPAEVADGLSDSTIDDATKRAAALVNRMTLEEVAGQLVNRTKALPALQLARYNYWSEALHGVNVNGPITSFPQPIALGCSWNEDLVHRVYTAVSDEARAFHNKTGYGLTFFSPATVNMGLRDPRWGRVNENFSEDPLLVQTLAVQATHGMQGDHPKYLKTVSCAKHYICNDTDEDRDYADAAPDRRSFWEYYTRGFEASVKQGRVFSVMAAYSSLWGVPCPANRMLLTEILRERWGFKGYVVSDCDAIADIYQTHHYVETAPEAAAAAINAGSDLNCGNTFSDYLVQACQGNLVQEEAIRSALVRVLTARFLLGEFDPPSAIPWTSLSPEILEGQRHRDLAREAARQSLVLLKNDGALLPLDKRKLKKVAVIGPMAGACHLGGYSGRAVSLISPEGGITVAFGAPLYSDVIPAGRYLSTSNFSGPIVAFSDDGAQFLTNIRNNDWAQYGPLDFTDKTAIEFEVASTANGEIHLYLDGLDNAPVLTVRVQNTGSLDTWRTVSAPLPGIAGSHIVFIRFTAEIRQHFLNLRMFRVLPVTPEKSQVAVTFAPGCTIDGPRNDVLFDSAVKAAKEADAVIVFVGVNRLLSDEGRDRTVLSLPGVQHDLIEAVIAANQQAVIVVNTDCPVALSWEKDNAPALLCAFFAGEQQGNAIADVLFGDYNPGGKLCSTWFRDSKQLPNFHDYDIKHGRTYMYFQGDPLYPFGYGLSYTSFSYENLQISSDRLLPSQVVTVLVDVSNTGQVAGDEVVQLYVHIAASIQQRPVKQLAGFRRISLQPREKQTVTFSLPHDHIALRYWDEEKDQFTYEPGDVELFVGSSSADIRLHNHLVLA